MEVGTQKAVPQRLGYMPKTREGRWTEGPWRAGVPLRNFLEAMSPKSQPMHCSPCLEAYFETPCRNLPEGVSHKPPGAKGWVSHIDSIRDWVASRIKVPVLVEWSWASVGLAGDSFNFLASKHVKKYDPMTGCSDHCTLPCQPCQTC